MRHAPPVGVEYLRNATRFVGYGKAAVASLFAKKPNHFRTLGFEDYDANGKAEMLEVLADSEEVRCQVVV